jgi:subtilase family serine protease
VINSSNRGSTTLRNGPDVAANANFTFYTCGDQTSCLSNTYGGTSFAAPMWAGYVALANQQAAANSQSPVGFLNPTIYNLNVTSSYATNFHDITSGTSGSYSAVTAYDLVTGWGSPTPNLISALIGSTTPPTSDFSIAASPASISVVQGAVGSSTISTAIVSGSASNIALTASNLPTGVSVSFSPSSVTAGSSSTASFTVAGSTATGTYTITITGTGSTATHTTTVSLTVTAAAQGSFSLADSPTSRTIRRGGSTTTSVTATPLNGFNSSIALSVSGQTSGLSFAFSPGSINGSGSSTLTISSSHGASTGVRTLTITGTGGGQTHSTTFTLTINK